MGKKRNTNIPRTFTTPHYLAEHVVTNENTLINGGRVDDSQFDFENAQTVTTTAIAAQGAVSVAVSALAKKLPLGSLLYFGNSKMARLSAAAAAGATTLAVEPLPVALASGDTAKFAGSGRKFIPGGTLLGRADNETLWGPWVSGDTEAYLLIYDIQDAQEDDDCELLLGGFQIYHEKLPGWTALPDPTKTFIRSKYICLRGPVANA